MTVWAPVDAAEPETEYRWLARVWLLVAAFAVVTLLRSEQVGIGLKDPHGEILRSRVALSLGLFLVLALGDAWLRAGRTDRSAAPGPRGAPAAVDRERRLALADGRPAGLPPRLLLLPQPEELGRPPTARATPCCWPGTGGCSSATAPRCCCTTCSGQHVAAYVLMVVYESFATLVSVALRRRAGVPDRIRDGYVFIALGAVGVDPRASRSYYLIPSLGPFHAAPQEFAGLPHTMIQDTQARYMAQRPHLLAHPHAARRLRAGVRVREPARGGHHRDPADGALLRAAPDHACC